MQGRTEHRGPASLWPAAVAMVLLLAATPGSLAQPANSAAVAQPADSSLLNLLPPSPRSTPDLSPARPSRPGRAAPEVWSEPPGDVDLRSGPRALLYDNGEPLDDYGDPASQLSQAAGMWQFIAATADDFTLSDQVSPNTNYRITTVRGTFTFFRVSPGEDPRPFTYWDGVAVTVYGDSSLGMPNEEPLQNGGHTSYHGGPIATQYVLRQDLLSEVKVGACRPCYVVDIPVNFVLAKNTRYWLSLVPRFNAPPQAAWCISKLAGQGLQGMQGASFGITWWTPIEGNYGCPNATGCPAECAGLPNPAAGTNKDLSFQLYGSELPPNEGACCDQLNGVCVDVNAPAACTGAYDLFHPGTLCQFLDPPCDEPVTGACCTETASSGTCADGVWIDQCQPAPNRRFAANTTCAELQPLCGAGSGRCCFPDQHCELLAPAACEYAGGTWQAGDCSIMCPPPNDDCADATVLPENTLVSFTTAGATTDGPPVAGTGCTAVNQDIWFKYTAPCTGNLSVSLCNGTTYDSALAVYQDCACPATSARQIACDDNGCIGGSASELIVPVVQNACYLVRVGGAVAATGAGNIQANCLPTGAGACCVPAGDCQQLDQTGCTAVSGQFHVGELCTPLVCRPPNDACADAMTISDGSYAFDTRWATTDGPDDSPGGPCVNVHRDIWYEYTAPCDGQLVASLCAATNYDSAVAIYEGCGACPPTSLVGCDNDACGVGGASKAVANAIIGTCYLIRVGGANESTGTGTLTVGCLPPNMGACCHVDETCDLTLPSGCTALGDAFSPGELCSTVTCVSPIGACCFLSGDCVVERPDECAAADGMYQGNDTTCSPNPCVEPIPCCVGDANNDGVRDGRDVGPFIRFLLNPPAYGTVQFCWANVNDSDWVIDMADVPPFVQLLLDGPPCDPQPTGACCFGDGSCTTATHGDCALSGGTYHGDNVPCSPNPCPPPPAACCFSDGSCQVLGVSACAGAGGSYQGVGTSCTPNPCPPPPTACCFADGSCQMLGVGACIGAGGSSQGAGTNCTPNQCPPPPDCCLGDVSGDAAITVLDIEPMVNALLTPPTLGSVEFCRADVNEDLAVDGRDIQLLVELLLGSATCQPPAACCFQDGSCQVLDVSACSAAGGLYQGAGTTCSPNLCLQPPAACCFPDGSCQVLDVSACSTAGGTYQGAGTNCTPNLCPPPPPACCLGDLSADGAITMLDVEPMVSALLTPPTPGSVEFCRADVNEDLAVDGRDVQPFVELLLSGATCGPPPCCLGDASGDEAITMLDVAPMVSALLTPPTPGSVEFCRADVNKDLAVDGGDIQPFVQLLLSGATCD